MSKQHQIAPTAHTDSHCPAVSEKVEHSGSDNYPAPSPDTIPPLRKYASVIVIIINEFCHCHITQTGILCIIFSNICLYFDMALVEIFFSCGFMAQSRKIPLISR